MAILRFNVVLHFVLLPSYIQLHVLRGRESEREKKKKTFETWTSI
jgi:hypothetical protein